jgi:tripartite-type tricarboxylate transporter receptor subunit TctC
MVINPHVFPKIPFDTLADFAPVTKLGDATLILVAHPSAGVRSLNELIEKGESRSPIRTAPRAPAARRTLPPSSSSCAPARSSSTFPTRAAARRWSTCSAGRSRWCSPAIASAQQYVRNGRLFALGVPSAKRSGALPDVPTFQESGPCGFRRRLVDRDLRAGENAALL